MGNLIGMKFKQLGLKKALIGIIVGVIAAHTLVWSSGYLFTKNTGRHSEASESTARDGKIPNRHLYFLKIHKTGSSTFNHLVKGFAIRNNLKYPIFKEQDTYPDPDVTNHLYPMQSAVAYASTHDLTSVPQKDIQELSTISRTSKIAENQCDIIDTHTVCNPQAIYKIMPDDTVFVVSIREPFSHFLSAANQWRVWQRIGLRNSANPIRDLFQTKNLTNTLEPHRNRQAKEMGCNVRLNTTRECVEYANKTFHVAIIAERYHESLVLFKTHMQWSSKDILYLKINEASYKAKTIEFDDNDRGNHRKWSSYDYAIYDMFSTRQATLVKLLGSEFTKEVDEFNDIIANVSRFCTPLIYKVLECRNLSRSCEHLFEIELTVNSYYGGSFTVNTTECLVMGYRTKYMISIMYLKQFYPWLCYPKFQQLTKATGLSNGFVYNPNICPEQKQTFEYNYPRSMLLYGGYLEHS